MPLISRRPLRRLAVSIAGAAVAVAITAPAAMANHPVLVEGNCNNPPDNPFFAGVPVPGTCGDYDGDGRIGPAEDGDSDRVFGTINGANGPAGTNNNGTITIVTSGLFPETVRLTGNVTLEAAPGVEANLDAVRQGDPATTARQGDPGIVVDAPADRYVVIRNITSRNWTSGFRIVGNSRVALDGVRAEHNTDYGIEVTDRARVAITGSEVLGTGFRLNPATGNFPTANRPDPGRGIEFEDDASGAVRDTTITGSFGAGLADASRLNVCAANVTVFDNNPDAINLGKLRSSCVGTAGGRI